MAQSVIFFLMVTLKAYTKFFVILVLLELGILSHNPRTILRIPRLEPLVRHVYVYPILLVFQSHSFVVHVYEIFIQFCSPIHELSGFCTSGEHLL